MPQGSLLQRPSFLPIPSALVTFSSANGAVHLFFAGWFGVVCDSAPLLTVCFRPETDERELLRAGDPFVVNLPADEMLQELAGSRLTGPAGSRRPLSPLSAGEVPLVAACPVRIECRCCSQTVRFGQWQLCGEVLAVYIDGQRHEVTAAVDFCRLLALHRRSFHRNCEALRDPADG